MSTKTKKEKYEGFDLPDEAFESRNIKARITMMIDMDLIESYRKLAKEKHTKYQTLMNQKLREALEYDESESLADRVNRLEKQVFKKRA